MEISKLINKDPEGTKSFPLYHLNELEEGKVFAEASMGFQGKVDYGVKGTQLTVKASTTRPVLATLGCQLAGWTMGDAMISGPVRMKAKKPGFIFDKIDFSYVPELPSVACIEGEIADTRLINEMNENGIESAEVLCTTENSKTQFINIPARAIEIALFRLSFLADINDFRISKAISNVETSLEKENLNCELNDSIRFNGQVTLMGDFGGFRDFDPIVTKHAGLYDQTFKTVMDEVGSVANCPLELFSVSQLTIIDQGKTRVF
jgi:methenyltetrahydromethanopterin cyclohydrolase